jgi:4-hydroxybenzoate polyprenyltransferase
VKHVRPFVHNFEAGSRHTTIHQNPSLCPFRPRLSISLWQAYQIDTLATRVGVKRIAQGASFCLLGNYIHAMATGLLAKSGTFRMLPMVGGHLALAGMLIYRYRQLDPDSMASIKKYYKHIWDLFYLEYGLYTLI